MEPEYFKTCEEILTEADKFTNQIRIMEDTIQGMVNEIADVCQHQADLWHRWYCVKFGITPGVTQVWHKDHRFVLIGIEHLDPHAFDKARQPMLAGHRIIKGDLIGQRLQMLRGLNINNLPLVIDPVRPKNQQDFLDGMKFMESLNNANRKP